MDPRPFLSIVIPAYNEESRIRQTLVKISAELKALHFTSEILVVDDGSTDSTANLVKEFSNNCTYVELIQIPHGGKGKAIQEGMQTANGEYCFICDADLSMPIKQITRFLPPDGPPSDVIIGSRQVKGARRIGEPFLRHIMGRIFNLLVRVLLIPNVKDSQCGFKCFKHHAAKYLSNLQRIQGFGFDVEILFIARKLNLSMKEIPIDWYYKSFSKVNPVKDSLGMLRDILSVRWNSLRGRYNNSL